MIYLFYIIFFSFIFFLYLSKYINTDKNFIYLYKLFLNNKFISLQLIQLYKIIYIVYIIFYIIKKFN